MVSHQNVSENWQEELELEAQLNRIGRVLDVHWVASL